MSASVARAIRPSLFDQSPKTFGKTSGLTRARISKIVVFTVSLLRQNVGARPIAGHRSGVSSNYLPAAIFEAVSNAHEKKAEKKLQAAP
jgi:hypothetical protein